MGLREEKVDFWRAKGKNSLLIGPSGVGKTALVRECMARADLSFDTNVAQWSTPLLDFVGPKAEDADVLYFDALDDVRAQEAAREILSLRRWKGKAIKPTAVVWASFTTVYDEKEDDDSDPPVAVKQMFEVVVSVPNKPVASYFESKFPKNVVTAALRWWDDLPYEEQRKVSPRRLEQALKMWQDKGDMRDVLPISTNVAKLLMTINVGPIEEKLKDLLTHNEQERRLFLSNENNYAAAFKHICGSDAFMRAFLPCFSKEKLVSAMGDKVYGDKVAAYVGMQSAIVPVFGDVVRQILCDKTNPKLEKKFRRMLTTMNQMREMAKEEQQPGMIPLTRPSDTVSETPEQ